MTDKPSPRRQEWLRQRQRSRRRVRLWQAGLLAALLGLWQLTTAVGLSDGFLISSPSRMWGTLVGLCRGGELLRHVGVSCLETVVGFLAGTLLGTAIAICMWWREGVARVLSPYLVVLNALPKTALGPIFIVWMGAGMGSIIVMTLAISLIVTILSMYQGFLGTDGEKLRLMRSLGATRGQILWMLVFPASFPTLFNTLKVNVGLSWVGVIMGEFLVSRAGLGYLIVYGSQVFNMDLVMASVVILAAAAVVMYRLVLGPRSCCSIIGGSKHEKNLYRTVSLSGGAAGSAGLRRGKTADPGAPERGHSLGVLRAAVCGHEPGLLPPGGAGGGADQRRRRR